MNVEMMQHFQTQLLAKDMFNTKLLKSLPYLITIIIGVLFYFIAILLLPNLRNLFINISAAFLAIPLLYFFYEKVNSFAHRKLNREILDYAKMQVDRELLSLVNQLQKTVRTLEEKDFSTKGIVEFISLKKEDLEKQFQDNKYLGFQIFKHWEVGEKGLHDLLKNPFILGKLNDEQIISIISILKSLRSLELIQKTDNLYIETGETAEGYKIQSGIEINPDNNRFPERHLLLKHLIENKFVVFDFGDIAKYNLNKSLKYFRVNGKAIKCYAEIIFDLLKDINIWLDITGSELIFDEKMFRVRSTMHKMQ